MCLWARSPVRAAPQTGRRRPAARPRRGRRGAPPIGIINNANLNIINDSKIYHSSSNSNTNKSFHLSPVSMPS